MPQTYLDTESLQILKDVRNEIRTAGTKGATYGDAVRHLKKAYDAQKAKNSPSVA
jgi:hypothetical protein